MVKFLINVANELCLRGLASEMNKSSSAIRKELNNLVDVGYFICHKINHKIAYKANQYNPFLVYYSKLLGSMLV